MRIGPSTGLAPVISGPGGGAFRLELDFIRGEARRDGVVQRLDDIVQTVRATPGRLFDGRAFGPGEMRRGPRGLLIEEGRDNLVADAFAPADQVIAVAAVPHVLSVGPGGGATISGAASGSATPGAPLAFTPAAAGDLSLSITGTPDWVQIEPGAFATSPIETPAGAGGARAGDVISLPDTSSLDPSACKIEVEWEQLQPGGLAENGVATLIRWTGALGYSRLRAGSVSFAQIRGAGGGLAVNAGAGQATPAGIHRLSWEAAGAAHQVAWSEGLSTAAGSSSVTSETAATGIDALTLGSNGGAEFLNGWLRRITVL